MPGPDEATLIQRACHMDKAAIGELYRRHVQAIYRYVTYRVGDAHLAEDLTAEVFVRAIEGLPAYEDRGVPFSSWLYSIARARVADHFRRLARTQTVPLESEGVIDKGFILSETEQAAPDRRLRSALERLTVDQQQVILLKFVEGLSNAEIAQIMDKTEGAIKSLQHRALKTLHRLIDESDEPR